MAPHSNTLAWKIPWMERPGRLQSMGSLRVGHDWATSLSLFPFMHWRRKWQPTPVFLPGESQGWRSLVGCRLWGRRVGHDWSDLAAAAAKGQKAKMTQRNLTSNLWGQQLGWSSKLKTDRKARDPWLDPSLGSQGLLHRNWYLPLAREVERFPGPLDVEASWAMTPKSTVGASTCAIIILRKRKNARIGCQG